MHLSCRQCAAPLTPDAQALRDGLATCAACDTLQRLRGEDGELVVPAPRGVPAGATVETTADGLRLTVPRISGSPAVQRRELVVGGAVAAFVLVAGGCGLGTVSVFPAGLAGLVAVAVAALLRRWLPPLVVDARMVRSEGGLARPVTREELRQVYVTVRDLPWMEGKVTWASVWALTRSGERVHLLGPVDDPGLALWAEEEVELCLGLLDVAVEGDHARPVAQVKVVAEVPLPRPAGEHLEDCVTCGAPLTVDRAAEDAGVAACRACGGLTLVWHDDEHPVLGVGGVRMPAVLELTRTPEGLIVQRKAVWDAGSLPWRVALLVGLFGLLAPLIGAATVMMMVMLSLVHADLALFGLLMAPVLLLAGLVLAVGAATSRWRVEAVPRRLRARWSPVPLPGGTSLVGPIRVSVRASGKQASLWQAAVAREAFSGAGVPSMDLRSGAVLRVEAEADGRRVVLADGLEDPREAFEVAEAVRGVVGP